MSQVPMNLPFESLASYDKPQILLTQALDNELTVRGALQTLVDVDGLSPAERDSFTTRLKERIGRNAVTDSLVDVVTNPFVLLMMVTSPVGGSALSRAGKAIFDVGERYSPFIKQQGGFLAALGGLTPEQLFRGTALTPAVQAFTKGVSDLEQELMGTVGEPLRKVLERHGLESLNPEMVRDGVKKAKAQELNDALFASLGGFDRGDRYKVLEFGRDAGGELTMALKEKTTPRMLLADMDRVVDGLGIRELRDAYRKAMADRRMKLFGDEAASAKAGKFVADEQKLLRAWQGVKLGFKGSSALKGTGAEAVAVMFGPEVTELIQSGAMPKGDVTRMLKELIEGQPAYYMPRNVIDLKGARSMQDVLEQRRSRSLVATGSTLTRSSTLGNWDPEDLSRLFDKFGATTEGVKTLMDAEKKVKAIVDRGESARTFRINAQESLARYFRDTGVTHALYVQTEDRLPILSQAIKDTRGMAKPEKLRTIDREMARSPAMDGRKSLAQVFQEEHFLLEDRFAKEALEVVLRQATGVEKIEHAATHMALIKGKQGIDAMLRSPVGKAMKGSGKWGQGLYDRLDEVAKAELTFGGAKSVSGELARYFYVTHLGLNLGSVTMNLMQPLLMASSWGGLGNVMKAYGSAFRELGGYVTERFGKYGVRALTDLEHQDLIRKHFKFANMEGENLIRIGRDTFSTLDAISFKSDALAGIGRKESYFYDYPMKLFEKAEWLNRSVAAHTVENVYKGAGRNVAAGSPDYYRMVRDVDAFVGATQFGGDALNTPLMFQGTGPFGRIGNNPLFRQFLSFPLRSVTSLVSDSPRLGDRGVLKGIGQDFIRGMGISAVWYEVGKNAFGVDLSPGLYGASLTSLAGGDRFFWDGNEYVPIPPVIDIPVNIVRGALDPGQRQLLQDNIPRLVPGGIAISRALGMTQNLPESPLFGLPGALQKTYVDFERRTQDGMVPVYKADGSLIDYQSPGQIFAKQLGVDLGTFKSTADFDGFLLKNREQIVEYRRRAIQALLNNEIPKMQSIKAEFKRRYKMDLTISKDQLDEAIKNRTVSRTERILDRMPPDQRGQFMEMAAGREQELGLEPGALAGAETARQRAESRRIQSLPVPPEVTAAVAQETGFQGFQAY